MPRSAKFLEQLLEVIEPGVADRDGPGALAPGANLHRGAETLRDLLLEAREVAVVLFLASRGGPAQQARGERFGLAHGKPARRDAVRRLDLARAVERQQRPRVAHLERAFEQQRLHGLG